MERVAGVLDVVLTGVQGAGINGFVDIQLYMKYQMMATQYILR